jgi:hypothetical protein
MQVGKANSCIKVYSFLVPDLLLKFNHTTFSKSTKEPCYNTIFGSQCCGRYIIGQTTS